VITGENFVSNWASRAELENNSSEKKITREYIPHGLWVCL
jgi:hypothetical protein